MNEHPGAATFRGNPLTLCGDLPKVGQKAPDFTLLGNDLAPVNQAAFAGQVLVLLTVPSLDTPVCDREVRRFNEAATKLSSGVTVVAVSMDLPFAQKRWCGAAGIERVRTLSDHRDAAFGQAYGVLIQELRLLARAVFVVGRAGLVQYAELVTEMTKEPDYAAALAAVENLVGAKV